LSDESDTLPATYDGRNCYYTIAEETVPEGYTLVQISGDKVKSGMLTAYNKKNSVDITLVKEDKNNSAIRLNGASFALRALDPDKTGSMDTRSLAGTSTVTKTTAGEGAEKGTLTFDGLAPGYYEIKETAAPEGYVLYGDGAFYIKITNAGIQLLQKDETAAAKNWSVETDTTKVSLRNMTATVVNEPGAALPNTGGSGTRVLYLMGMVLIFLAGMGLVTNRRRTS
jgi:LPXTG-motif cell wall-anchored protein